MFFRILAHRANLNGPSSCIENSLDACRQALEAGFGLEIDLRRTRSGVFYLSHDRRENPDCLLRPRYDELFRAFPNHMLAINIKELGYEAALVQLWESGVFGAESFYFDFELLEPDARGTAQRAIREVHGGRSVRLAARLSDRGESIEKCLSVPSEIVWADEFDGPWLEKDHVDAVHAANRAFVVVSPELHGCTDQERVARWEQFKRWGIDGICTDFALSAREFFLS